ncbi:MAG: alpha/beta hydrolase [Planctomycetota bacterium]|jgi:fermentation-respiration switch protein FrsA (DUF1100 family)
MRVFLWTMAFILVGVTCYRRYKQGKLMAVVITIFSIIAAVYIGMGLLLFFNQGRMLYQPMRAVSYTPTDVGLGFEAVSLTTSLGFEAVSLTTSDGVTLAGWYVPAAEAERTVLFCHGNAGNISHRLDTLKMFHELGLNCLIVDYRGYGQSNGKPTEKGTIIDIKTCWDWLIEEKGVRPEEIILFGRSLGGSVAAAVANDVNPACLVVESAFTSFDDIGSHYYPWLPVRLFTRYRYNTLEAVKQIHCPLLVIHSLDDEIVPYKFGRQIFAAADEPKQFADLKGSHNEGFYNHDGLYKGIWSDWLEILNR